MKFTVCLAVLFSAVSCTLGQIICPAIWAPVCGNDGRTYSSDCFLNAAHQQGRPELKKVHNGECGSGTTFAKRGAGHSDCSKFGNSNICTLEYAPVCASDGKTYPNHCFMCADVVLSVVHFGECESAVVKREAVFDNKCPESSKQHICTDEYAPVCGSDYRKYASLCVMCSKMYKIREDGWDAFTLTVIPMKFCPTPVVKREAVDDECPESSKHHVCTFEYAPVCASDGQTYPTRCVMCSKMYEMREGGMEGYTLSVVHAGACGAEEKVEAHTNVEFCRLQYRSGICTREYEPFCGSDGKTYANRCNFCHAMYQKSARGGTLNVRREGQCQKEDVLECPASVDLGICTMEYNPVCGSDGRMYGNPCEFCTEQKKQLENGVELNFERMGHCLV